MTTRKFSADQARPPRNRGTPGSARRRETAYQSPSIPATSGICSLVVPVSTAKTRNGTSRSSSRNQTAKRSRGTAKLAGWKPLSGVKALNCVAGKTRYASARWTAARSLPRCLRASQKTGSAPVATASAWSTSSMSGLGHTHQSGASRTRKGSACEPSRTNVSPVSDETSSRRPCAVFHTAWVMFPTS